MINFRIDQIKYMRTTITCPTISSSYSCSYPTLFYISYRIKPLSLIILDMTICEGLSGDEKLILPRILLFASLLAFNNDSNPLELKSNGSLFRVLS